MAHRSSPPRRLPASALALSLLLALPVHAQHAPAEPAPPVPAEAGQVDAPADAMTAVAAPPPATDDPPAPARDSMPPAADAPPPATADGAPTAAEDDFDALYGDAEAGVPARPAAYDPWERYNRRMHRFNNAVDRRVARPLARAYVRAVPAPVRTGVTNFFSNLGQPVSAVNALLQGRPRQAGHSLGRFVLNSTLGIAGVFDPATAAQLENRSEDFGQTLGVWGWRRSRYVELPLFGPRTLRDVVGMAGDAPLSPLRQVDADRLRVPLQGLQLVDVRTQLLSTDALREDVEDDYALVRDAWSQRRDYQIQGDRERDAGPLAPREKPTLVPVDAIPVTLPGG
jgi:phospholipid-binding lipoprotein MlaA